MIRYEAGELVKRGFYFNQSSAEFTRVSTPWGNLPWDASGEFIRVPGILVVALAPVLGGLFVMFLPFIAFAMVLGLAAKGFGRAGQWLSHKVLAMLIPQWRPGEAYLARLGTRRQKKAEKGSGEGNDLGTPKEHEAEPRIEDLAREIERKRQGGQ
ncbi:MAG: hypothetical protein HYY65_03550 [Candidatus Tectomicrobia bacterium]|uniref:Uncharacterized protein n=1 Tax=Tectimicrobiota bacterium TaxID=2528274 RepID=A0A932GNK4_UNCTE|nr:hypothetical protein [Candidatus Tectomicrobia bacterium]